ncbi:MAG: hypothetical protein E7277_10120 [Lachnospiraceae bacterium]|nr:hypothetical protein [Lachnospiraceae bacterium]
MKKRIFAGLRAVLVAIMMTAVSIVIMGLWLNAFPLSYVQFQVWRGITVVSSLIFAARSWKKA